MKTRLDWAAYFRVFCEIHGDPVPYRGRLLFQDGFMYSATNHAGPEYWPDEVDVPHLSREYWTIRLRMVTDEAKELRLQAKQLVDAQYGRSAPLQQVVTYKDDDGKVRVESGPVDKLAIEERLRWLTQDIEQCREMLALKEAA